MSAAANRSRPGGVLLAGFLLPVALGAGLGYVATRDPGWVGASPIRILELHRHFPYLATFGLTLLLTGSVWLFARRERLFARRWELAIAAAIVPGAFAGFSAGPLDATNVGMLAALLFFLPALALERRPMRVPIAALVMAGLIAVCSLLSVARGGFGSLVTQHTFLTKPLLFFLVASLAWSLRLARAALAIFAGVALFSALIGVIEEILYVAVGYAFTLDQMMGFAFKATPFGVMLRAAGFLPRAQAQSHLMILALPLVMAMPWLPWKRWGAIGLLGAGQFCTLSLGGWAIMTAVFLLMLVARRPPRIIPLILIAAIGGVTIHATGAWELIDRNLVEGIGGKSGDDRVDLLTTGLAAIHANPWFGVGLRNIGRVSHAPIHNAYLQTMAEIGVAAGVLLLLLPLYLMARTGSLALRAGSEADADRLRALAVGLAGMMFHFCLEPYQDNYLSWAFMGLAAAAIAVHAPHPLAGIRLRPARRWQLVYPGA